MPKTMNFIIPKEYDGKKLLVFLRSEAKFSSRLISKLKKTENGIMKNGVKIRTIDKVNEGETIKITLPNESSESIEPVNIEIDILYEDDDVLIVNKSPGIAMHPTHNHQGNTLANAVAWHLLQKGKSSVFRAIGRLDKGTSGVVICALNRYSASRLSEKIAKEYVAIVTGEFYGRGTIDIPIYRPHPMKTLRACGEVQGCEKAVTHWESLKSGNGKSLLKIKLETGRTHQIRVHFSHLGAPLLGDTMYGDSNETIGHQLLHCAKVRFIHPVTKERVVISSSPPNEFFEVVF